MMCEHAHALLSFPNVCGMINRVDLDPDDERGTHW